MGVTIYSGATYIHGYIRYVNWFEWAFPPGHGIINLYGVVCHFLTSIELTRRLVLFLVKSMDTIVSIFPSSMNVMCLI